MVKLSHGGGALQSHGQGHGHREGWKIGAITAIRHMAWHRDRDYRLWKQKDLAFGALTLGFAHLSRYSPRCLPQSCFPTRLCPQLAATARNLLFNIAFQLLMRLSVSRIFAFKDPSCFFRLQGNTSSVPSAHARQITAIELLPPHPEWKLSTVNIFFHTSFLYPFEISSLCQVQGHALLNILF